MLVNSYIAGTYQYRKKDIPFLIDPSLREISEATLENLINKDQYDIIFPPLTNKQRKVTVNKKYFKINLNKSPTDNVEHLDVLIEKIQTKDSMQNDISNSGTKINVQVILEAEERCN